MQEQALTNEEPAGSPETGAGQGYVPIGRHKAPPRERRGAGLLLGVVIALMVVVLGMQVYVVTTVGRNTSDLDSLNLAVGNVQNELGAARQQVGEIAGRLDTLESRATSSGGASSAPSAAPAVPGGLPTFQSTQNDPAVTQQMKLGDVTGPEFYTGELTTVDPGDGTSRVWMIWAHWCPYCQQELPVMKEWWSANRTDYPNIEIVTVTTSIDPSRDNPLIPYLRAEQFPFPVIVDEDLQLALQFGTVAYPYWVVTAGDGTVVLRATGLLERAQMEGLFIELERLAAEA